MPLELREQYTLTEQSVVQAVGSHCAPMTYQTYLHLVFDHWGFISKCFGFYITHSSSSKYSLLEKMAASGFYYSNTNTNLFLKYCSYIK